jgi:hypothetical protein
MENLTFLRRIGPDPHLAGDTPSAQGCPDVWELSNGDFAVIGIRATDPLASALPEGASCGPDEEIVIVPRRILTAAKDGIPRI